MTPKIHALLLDPMGLQLAEGDLVFTDGWVASGETISDLFLANLHFPLPCDYTVPIGLFRDMRAPCQVRLYITTEAADG